MPGENKLFIALRHAPPVTIHQDVRLRQHDLFHILCASGTPLGPACIEAYGESLQPATQPGNCDAGGRGGRRQHLYVCSISSIARPSSRTMGVDIGLVEIVLQ